MIYRIIRKIRYWSFLVSLFFRPSFWRSVQNDVRKFNKISKEIDEFLTEEFKNYRNG